MSDPRRLWELHSPSGTRLNVMFPDGDFAIILFTTKEKALAFREAAKGSKDVVPSANCVQPVILGVRETRKRWWGPEVIVDPESSEDVVNRRPERSE